MTEDRPLLVLDTATRTPVVGLARADGVLLDASRGESRHRHGEELLQRLDDLLGRAGVDRRALGGVIVGTGPGSFTGLRIGLATAKVVAYGLGVLLVGISSTRALGLAAARAGAIGQDLAVTLPAGSVDRYVHAVRVNGDAVEQLAPPRLVATDEEFEDAAAKATIVAIDLDGSVVDADAMDRGRQAVTGLAGALAALGAAALMDGQRDDPAQLVPAYVALPRGIARAAAEMEWSPDLR